MELDRPNVIGNPYLRNTDDRHWLNAQRLFANPVGTFGNAGVMSVFGPGYFEVDASLSRSFQVV